MHFFRRRPMTMIWLDLAVTGLQLLYLHGPGSNNAMSEKQVQAVFKCLGVDICSPQCVACVCSSKLRNLKWVVDFHLLEWHYLEGTINHKLEAWQLQSMISYDPWLILMSSIGLVWTQHLQQEKPQDCIIRLCLTLKACQSVSWWCSFGKGAAWNIWCWLIFVQVWPWQPVGASLNHVAIACLISLTCMENSWPTICSLLPAGTGVANCPFFWVYWTSPYSSHYRPYT